MTSESDNQKNEISIKHSNLQGDVFIGGKTDINNFFFVIDLLTLSSGESQIKREEIIRDIQSGIQVTGNSINRRYVIDLRRVYSAILQQLGENERTSLLPALYTWIGPLVEKYRKYEDFDAPYGEFCRDLIDRLSIIEIVTTIFKTKSLYQDIGSFNPKVYLKTLSKQFPIQGLDYPSGYYLYNQDPPKPPNDSKMESFSRIKSLIPGEDDEQFLILFYAPLNWDGWKNFTTYNDFSRHRKTLGLKEKLTGVVKNFSNVPDKYAHFQLSFHKQDIEFISLSHAKNNDYLLKLDFKKFSTFLLPLAIDILSHGAKAIEHKTATERDKEILYKPFQVEQNGK